MTKTLKLGLIFFITVAIFIVMRILSPLIPLSDNWSGWLFSFCNQVLNMVVLPIVLYRLIISKKKKDFVKDFRLRAVPSEKTWFLTLGVGFLTYFVTLGIAVVFNVVLQLLGYTFTTGGGTIYSSGIVLVMEILMGAMLPAICEEFADRGLLLAVLDGERSDNKKIIILAIMFGLLHQNILQFGYAMFGGFVMGYLAVKTGSIYPGMMVHFLNNFIGILISYSSQKGGALGTAYQGMFNFINSYFLVMLIVWVAAGLLLMWFLRLIAKDSKKRNKLRLEKEERPLPKPLILPRSAAIDDDEAERHQSATIDDDEAETHQSATIDDYGAETHQSAATEVYETETRQRQARQDISLLFQFDQKADAPIRLPVRPREYVFLYATVVMTALTTIFTFVWGLFR